MAQLEILRFGNPVLRKKSKRVPSISGSVQGLIDDMIETMQAGNGAGLAAPQVGKLLRLITLELPEEGPVALINPEIVKRAGEREVVEGCLSYPGYQADIKRSEMVICKALDRHGKAYRIKAFDIVAQALEHEIDHLNGVLYIDYLDSPDKLYKIEPE